MRDASKVSPGYVAAFGRQLYAGTHRDLDFLNTIEEICGALRYYTDSLRGQIRDVIALTEKIGQRTSNGQLDPSGVALSNYEQSQDAIASYVRDLVARRESAVNDPDLRDDDGVVEAYDEMIAAERDLHAALGDLIGALAEHDADRSAKIGAPAKSAEELIGLLRR
jgi:hypothetical protein